MKLSAYRAKESLTLAAMAERVGVGESAMSRYETGSRRPEWSVLARIMEITNGEVTANDFVEQADTEAA